MIIVQYMDYWIQVKVNDSLFFSSLAYWSRYVNHYLKGRVYKSRGIFAPHISRQQLEKMLPDYEVEPQRDRMFND